MDTEEMMYNWGKRDGLNGLSPCCNIEYDDRKNAEINAKEKVLKILTKEECELLGIH